MSSVIPEGIEVVSLDQSLESLLADDALLVLQSASARCMADSTMVWTPYHQDLNTLVQSLLSLFIPSRPRQRHAAHAHVHIIQ